MNTAKQKCWLKADGVTLVPDGDPEAAELFARKGQVVPNKRAVIPENLHDFFEVTDEVIAAPQNLIRVMGGSHTKKVVEVTKAKEPAVEVEPVSKAKPKAPAKPKNVTKAKEPEK